MGVQLRQLLYCSSGSFPLVPIRGSLEAWNQAPSPLHSQGVGVEGGYHGVRDLAELSEYARVQSRKENPNLKGNPQKTSGFIHKAKARGLRGD